MYHLSMINFYTLILLNRTVLTDTYFHATFCTGVLLNCRTKYCHFTQNSFLLIFCFPNYNSFRLTDFHYPFNSSLHVRFFMQILSRSPINAIFFLSVNQHQFLCDSAAMFAAIYCDTSQIVAKLHQVSSMFDTSAISRRQIALKSPLVSSCEFHRELERDQNCKKEIACVNCV